MVNVHGIYKCKECGECFGSDYELTDHWRSHSGEKPFECNKVTNVTNDSHCLLTSLGTAEFTAERNHTNVTCVIRHF